MHKRATIRIKKLDLENQTGSLEKIKIKIKFLDGKYFTIKSNHIGKQSTNLAK